MRCPRCRGHLRSQLPDETTRSAAESNGEQPDAQAAVAHTTATPSPRPNPNSWAWDEELRELQRAIDRNRSEKQQTAAYHEEKARLDLPASGSQSVPAWHVPMAQKRRANRKLPVSKPSAVQPATRGTGVVWAALSLGTMALVCGGILLGWSTFSGRQELWSIGLPIALFGQIGLVVGLILQLERMWNDSRRSAEKLETVDRQLVELKNTTAMLGTTHSGPSTAFYSHLVDGASPQILLTDLKSQLDLLAIKMGDER